MMKLVAIAFLITGCTMSFQPYTPITKEEVSKAISQLVENDKVLFEAVNKLSAQPAVKK